MEHSITSITTISDPESKCKVQINMQPTIFTKALVTLPWPFWKRLNSKESINNIFPNSKVPWQVHVPSMCVWNCTCTTVKNRKGRLKWRLKEERWVVYVWDLVYFYKLFVFWGEMSCAESWKMRFQNVSKSNIYSLVALHLKTTIIK